MESIDSVLEKFLSESLREIGRHGLRQGHDKQNDVNILVNMGRVRVVTKKSRQYCGTDRSYQGDKYVFRCVRSRAHINFYPVQVPRREQVPNRRHRHRRDFALGCT